MTYGKKHEGWRTEMGRRVFLGAGTALAIMSIGLWGISPAFAESRPLQMGSASLGSTGYVIIETLSAIINKYSEPKLRTSSMSTGGGA